jgi:hypothetical protein
LTLGLLTDSVPQEVLLLCVPLAHTGTIRIPKPETVMPGNTPENKSDDYDFLHNMTSAPQAKRFRFKERSRLSRDQRAHSPSTHHSSSIHDGHRQDPSRPRRKRRKTRPTEVDDPAAYDDSIHNLPPEAAFRESLFDAMADDEGATFWEGVYGQPIHNYPKSYVDQETGELEQMDDEEYAQYVRRKMWEKSWEGIEAQREERAKAQRAKERSCKEEARRGPGKTGLHNGRTFDFEVEESLRRGEERRQRKRWKTLWDDYLQRWISLQRLIDDKSTDSADAQQTLLRNKIAWPVESGKRDDVSPALIENFVLNGAKNANPDLDHETALLSALKVERVRWHPDKIQQRFGSLGIDEKTMKGVTAVFQVIDRMWSERKEQR